MAGLVLMVAAFGGFTFRPGGRWGLGRERQSWDARAVLSIPVTFIAIIVTGFLGSFVVLVPGAQTLESLKDLVVFLCVVLFGYPALITVPFAYGLSDLIEGVPPGFILDWLPGYFINPACFWLAYQLIGRDPDFRKARTWGSYAVFVALFLAIEPILWGHVGAGMFTADISYRTITPALFFTTGITWALAPFAMLAALPAVRRFGLFWAEIPGHVRERLLGHNEWTWESGIGTPSGAARGPKVWPIRMAVLAPFMIVVMVLVGLTSFVTLRSARSDADRLVAQLAREISASIIGRLNDHLARGGGAAPAGAGADTSMGALLRSVTLSRQGLALVVERPGRVVASSAPADDPVAALALEGLGGVISDSAALAGGMQYAITHITRRPLARTTWLARATTYPGRAGWVVLTAFPESFYLGGFMAGSRRSALLFAVALVLSLGVGVVLASRVTRGLRLIAAATHDVARGNLAARVPGSRLEELGSLSRSFNDMAARLESSVDELRGSEERIQLAVRAARLAIWDWDIQNDRLVWDDAMFRLYGVNREDFDGTLDAWLRALEPGDVSRSRAALDAALSGEREFAHEFRVVQRDGSVRIIRGLGQTLRAPGGRPLRMVGINWDVTEQFNVEQATLERETMLRLSQEAAGVGSFEWDVAENRFRWSEALARMHGISGDEFDGRPETIFGYCYPADRDRLAAVMEGLKAGADPGAFECRIRRKDGQVRDLWFLGKATSDFGGTVTKVLGIAVDVSDRKRIERIMAAETRVLGLIATGAALEAVLVALVSSIEELAHDTLASVLLLDRDGLRVRVGAAPSLPAGYSEAIDGEPIGPRAGSCGTAAYLRRPVIVSDIETDPLWESYRELAREHDLRACWSTPILDANQAVLGTFAMYYREPRSPTVEDFQLIERATRMAGLAIERSRAADALRSNEERLVQEKRFVDTLMNSLPGVVMLVDAEGRLRNWNTVLEKVVGYEAEQVAQLSLRDLIDRPDAAAMTAAIQQVQGGVQQAVEAHLLTSGGQAVPYYFSAIRLVTEQGPHNLIIGIDISDRRALEDQFRQAQKMEAVGHLAAGVAHDFNNLLTIISGYTQLLDEDLPPTDDNREAVEAIRDAAARAAALTRQLLTFSRKSVLQPRVLDLMAEVREMERMLRRVIGEDVRFDTAIDPDLPRVRVDPGQLGQVLMNLVVNARDAMPRGGALTIRVRKVVIDEEYCRRHPDARPGEHVALAVSDTGSGMTPEVRARIFEPFFTTKGVGHGTGLGLPMVYGMVRQSGGHIVVTSEVGRGTTFELFFPAAAGRVSGRHSRPRIDAVSRGTETVLLLEDDPGVRTLALKALSSRGFATLSASDGSEALRLAERHEGRIDLLVTDVVMPGLTGREVADALRAKRPELKVLYVSGYTDDAVVRRGIEQDEVEFLSKPYTPLGLAQRVREVLDSVEA